MKRNFDLIRTILLRIEETDFEGPANEMAFEDFSIDEVMFHASLLVDGGYIDGTTGRQIGLIHQHAFVRGLTWAGHNFLDSIRDATVWDKTKSMLRLKGLAVTIEGIKIAAPIALKAIFTD